MSFGLLSIRGWTLLLLVIWLYHSILYRLVGQWRTDENFSYCFVVPAFSVFVLWQERHRLKSIESAPSWAGVPVIVLSMGMLVLGEWGVEIFTERVSFLVLFAGLIIHFRGWAFFRAVFFPWAFLILMVPLPNLILQRFTFPMQLFASRVSTVLLQACGLAVHREGNLIYLAKTTLNVAEACSGIRSLLSLVTLAIIYGYLIEKRNWVRVVLACSAVPIAVAANVVRVFGAGFLAQHWDPDKSQGFFHEFQGWLIFVVSLILLFSLHGLINRIWKSGSDCKAEPLHRMEMHREEIEKAAVTHGPVSNWSPRFLLPALLMLATAAVLEAHSQNEVIPPRQLLTSFPQVDGWKSSDETLDQPTLDILGPGEFLSRDYVESIPPEFSVNLFIAYYPTQKVGDTVHSPNHCLPGAGWVPILRQIVALTKPDGSSFAVNRYVISQAGQRQLVLYWYQAHGRTVTSEYRLKYHLVSDSIHMNRSDGAMIRLITPMDSGESPDAAQARIMQLGDHLLPLLDNYIPR